MRTTSLLALTLITLAGSACATKSNSAGGLGWQTQPTRVEAPATGAPVSAAIPTPIATPAPAPTTARKAGPIDFDNQTHVLTQGTQDFSTGDAPEGLSQVTFAGEGADFDPSVGRDGKFVVFASTQHRPTADLYMAKIGSRAITQLTADPGNDVMPALSPDNKRVAFASDRSGSWQIYVMPASGGRAVQITDGQSNSGDSLHPTWSPDGMRLAFCRLGAVSGRWELWVVASANPASAEFIGYGLFPDWCPVAGSGEGGSDRIVFQRGRERADRAFGIWAVDYKAGVVGNPVELVSGVGAAAINPSWSPDGQFIAYTMTPTSAVPTAAAAVSKSKAASDVWVVSADGAARVNVTSGSGSSLSPTWGSDGRLFFVSNRGGRDQVWSVSSDKALAAMPGRMSTMPVAAKPAQPKMTEAAMAQKSATEAATPAPEAEPAADPMASVPTP